MHISKRYSQTLGVDVGRPIIQEHFFPISEGSYITVHNSDKVPAKNYSYWPEVIAIVKPELAARGIKIIQIGTKEDPVINGVDEFINFTTFKQSFFIIKNGLLHMGADSSPGHIASAYGLPTITPFAHTYSGTCKPIWNGDHARIVESHRNGNKPSFSLSEHPKTIDLIKPEELANECLMELGFKDAKTRETILIGDKFLHKTLDIIPENIPTQQVDIQGKNARIRMDLNHHEKNLIDFLKILDGGAEIITSQPINPNILEMLKSRVKKIIYFARKFDKPFLEYLHGAGINFDLNCTDKKTLADQRYKYFEFNINYSNEQEEAESLRDENIKKFRENKDNIKLSCGKTYLNGDQVAPFLNQDIESWKFWLDMPYCMAYLEKKL